MYDKKKIQLKNEYKQELYNTYPNAFELKENNPKFVKQQGLNNNFIKYMQLNEIIRKNIIKKIWITYFWYLMILLDTLDYSNRVEFLILKKIWISDAMIKITRKKLKDAWYIKKLWNNFFLNPMIAMKGEAVPPFIKTLFDN